MKKADIGLVGLAVMGENLAMNMEGKGFRVALYNRETEWVDRFLSGRGAGRSFIGCASLEELVSSLNRPRKIWLMIRAGSPVDEVIEKLLPLLDAGDVIIDGGNSRFQDSMGRCSLVEERGCLFIGMGVSGGEEGALKGPSLMPGGSPAAWPLVQPILQAVAARADGVPCCGWVGEGGAGHFVKMVHNGIEYGDMQLICEAYQLMRDLLGMSAGEMSAVFRSWNQTELSSYLIEITGEILSFKDEDGSPLVDSILDAAGQKGTGKWTAITALEEGVPLTSISEAVLARSLSFQKDRRMQAAQLFSRSNNPFTGDREQFLSDLRCALYASKIISYAQGYELMRAASEHYGWKLNYGEVALMWRGGCIIRSAFLGRIHEAFSKDPELPSLILAPGFREDIQASLHSWRRIAAAAIEHGIPSPAMTAALSYLDGFSCPHLGANLLQAQRDYFGAHTYERTDQPRGEFFHTDWTGSGSSASTSYNL